jgi:hypothetical protein
MMLAFSIGLFGLVAPAFAVPDKVETEKTNSYRGTSGGQDGFWVEYVTRTYRFAEDPQKATIRDAFASVFGREPNAAEWDQWSGALKKGTAEELKNDQGKVVDLYKQLLGRTPTGDELLAGLTGMVNGKSYQALRDELYAKSAARIAATFPGLTLSAAEINKIASLSTATLNNIGIPGGVNKDSIENIARGAYAWKVSSVSVADRLSVAQNARNGQTATRNWNTGELMKFVGWMDSSGQMLGYSQPVNNDILAPGGQRFGYQNGSWTGNFDRVAPLYLDNINDGSIKNRVWGGNYIGYNNGSYTMMDANTRDNVAWVMSEGQRYMDMYKAFNSVGATNAANEAKLRAQRTMALLASTYSYHDPIALDLNHNGKIDVTGKSAAKYRAKENETFVKEGAVMFDLLGNGKAVRTEWLKNGDGFLVDDTDGKTTKMIASGQKISCLNLFGDVDGHASGYFKLAGMDNESKFAAKDPKVKLSEGFGILKGEELKNLKVWIDDGDGVANLAELKTLAELGITEIGAVPTMVTKNGEILEQSYFVQNGKKYITQEIWFAQDKQ